MHVGAGPCADLSVGEVEALAAGPPLRVTVRIRHPGQPAPLVQAVFGSCEHDAVDLDLSDARDGIAGQERARERLAAAVTGSPSPAAPERSEERRVGKECRL